MRGFCYRCGIEDELIEGLCPVCYAMENPLIEIPEVVEIEVCHLCGSYKRKVWQSPKGHDAYEILDEIAYFATKDSIKKHHPDIEVEIIPHEPKQLPGGKRSRVEIPVTVIATGKLAGEKEEREERKDITVYLKMVQCPRCSRYKSSYYVATLQVRAMNRFLTDEEVEELDRFVREEVAKRLEKDRMAFITKFTRLKEGIDYQMGSMGGARNIAQAIKARYGGKITETAKLVGVDKDTGKNQYRITVVVRIPEYKIGDVVEYNEKLHVVTSMNENKLYMLTMDKRRDKISLSWNEVEKNTKLVKKGDECSVSTVISVTKENFMVMDDETYEVYELDKVVDVKEGDKVRIFKKDGVAYFAGKIDGEKLIFG